MTLSKFLSLFLSLSLGLMPPALAQSALQLSEEMQKALELTQPQIQFTRTAPSLMPISALDESLREQYRLGPGDSLEINLWNAHLQLQYTLTVSPQGELFIPRLGRFQVQGLKLQNFESQLVARIRAQFQDPVQVAVMLSKLRMVQVLVTGYVFTPGYYQVPWGSRLLEVLRRAGGVQDMGSVRRVQLIRQGSRQVVDLYQFHHQGLLAANPPVLGGEQIHVPRIQARVALTGQFQQPGQFELLPGETLVDLLAWAGGAKPAGDPDALLYWPGGLNSRGHPLETHALHHPLKLQDGDILYLPLRKLPVEAQHLTLYGQFQQPGVHRFRRGMTVQDALKLGGGPLPSADLSQLRISRLGPQGRTQLTLDLQAWLQGQNQQGDMELEPGDILYLPESFFNVRNVMELTTLVVGALGIVSVVLNLSRGQ